MDIQPWVLIFHQVSASIKEIKSKVWKGKCVLKIKFSSQQLLRTLTSDKQYGFHLSKLSADVLNNYCSWKLREKLSNNTNQNLLSKSCTCLISTWHRIFPKLCLRNCHIPSKSPNTELKLLNITKVSNVWLIWRAIWKAVLPTYHISSVI